MQSVKELYLEEVAKNKIFIQRIKELECQNNRLTTELEQAKSRIDYLETNMDLIVKQAVNQAVKKVSKAYEEKIQKLESQVASLKSTLNNDANNSSIPTSKTPIDKDKRIPNTREKSNKKRGGQQGHKKHILDPFEDEEVTDHVYHEITVCPNCCEDGTMTSLDSDVIRDEYEIDVTVKRIRHHFIPTQCSNCQTEQTPEIPQHLTAPNQYGSTVKAIILALLNQGFVSMNRTSELIAGFTSGVIVPSTGYIAKVQQRVSEKLVDFEAETKRAVIASDVVLWDDTVIMINKKRSCLRVYVGEFERVALYKAHERKDKAGVDEDGILLALGPETKVVHDHNIINYNADYDITNCECCRHLIGNFQKVIDILKHEWAQQFKELLTTANTRRNEQGYLDDEDAANIRLQWDELVEAGWKAVEKEREEAYYVKQTKALLRRLEKYKDNYLFWTVYDDVPFTNNGSERSLRNSKTKMKVSGQFQNIKSAQAYARIRTYIETGKRHGMNPVELLALAAQGSPATLDDMHSYFRSLNDSEA